MHLNRENYIQNFHFEYRNFKIFILNTEMNTEIFNGCKVSIRQQQQQQLKEVRSDQLSKGYMY